MCFLVKLQKKYLAGEICGDVTGKTITVYRLEDSEGKGPFRSKLQPRGQWIGSPNQEKAFPQNILKQFDPSKHLFGFKNKEDAKIYFENPNDPYAKGDWNSLLRYGFKLKLYRAKNVFYGKNMVFFEPERHKLFSR